MTYFETLGFEVSCSNSSTFERSSAQEHELELSSSRAPSASRARTLELSRP